MSKVEPGFDYDEELDCFRFMDVPDPVEQRKWLCEPNVNEETDSAKRHRKSYEKWVKRKKSPLTPIRTVRPREV